MLRMTALTLVGLTIGACTGTVIMEPLDAQTLPGKKVEGIIVYRAIPMVEVDKFIQVNMANGSQAPILSSDCEPVYFRKIVSIADWEHPYRLHYQHGFLEGYTFQASLTNDGILNSINTVSVPDQGKTISNLAGAASSGAAAAAEKKMVEAKLPCALTPVFVNYEHLPKQADIQPYHTICKGGASRCP